MSYKNFKKNLLINKQKKRLSKHSIHKYYGKLIPAIPFSAIELFSQEGDVVLDLFSGSGTTGLEAITNKRDFIGIEINPVAVMISKAKLSKYNKKKLIEVFELIKTKFNQELNYKKIFIPNQEHWYKKENYEDLCKLKFIINNNTRGKNKYFFQTIFSSIVRQSSMSDPTHIFPGKSKKMRELIASGNFNVNVIEKFTKAFEKSIKIISYDKNTKFKIINASSDIYRKDLEAKVDLIVTNPPYISSIRYEEATKLEIYFNEFATSSEEFRKLSKKFIGSDKHLKTDIKKIKTKYPEINQVLNLITVDKNRYTAALFFLRMEKVIINISRYLKKEGKAVIKIGDSTLSGVSIPTGILLNKIAEKNNLKVIKTFDDEIKSRSLTTARNSYSGMIKFDRILIWEKL